MLGRRAAGMQALDEAIALARQVNDVFSICRSLQYRSSLERASGALESASTSIEEALKIARQMNNRRQIAACLLGLSVVSFLRGDWQAAQGNGLAALEIVRALGATWTSFFHLGTLAALALAEGDVDQARLYLAETLMANHSDDVQTRITAEQVMAELELIEGESGAALTRLLTLTRPAEIDDSGRVAPDVPAHLLLAGTHQASPVPALLAWALIDCGSVDSGLAVARSAAQSAHDEGLRLPLVGLRRVEGMALARSGQLDAAILALDDSLSLAQEIGFVYGQALALYERGTVRSQAGDPAEAHADLARARDSCEELGARLYLARATEAFSRLPI